MKHIAAIILIVLCISSLSPLTTVRKTYGEQTVSFKTLDVCHQSGNMIFGSMEMPFISECPCAQAPLSFTHYPGYSNPSNYLPLTVIPIELPPNV
ncbi:MAG: hypothetical protein C4581_05975 [Nitrospiraceae bacterium]|nr:MAG: hypothetical protein C4581_05975 [Nitrospiraceae bacterium]